MFPAQLPMVNIQLIRFAKGVLMAMTSTTETFFNAKLLK